ncbi:MAG: hypothetical protein IV092_21830 [Burkholderiaceae bacterium]|nr:hypothetical protein [Burkholderiaceae bacterium]MBT9503898.1 hypothetical protein [Burkholderiaceae bacterium]
MKTLPLHALRHAALPVLAAVLVSMGSAATAATTPPAAPKAESAQLTASAGTPEPAVRDVIIEDEAMRIEETRVRGQLTKVTVQPKGSKAPAYEILLPTPGQDVSGTPGPQRGGAGQRVWRVMSF